MGLPKYQDSGKALLDMSDFQQKPKQSDTLSDHEVFKNTDIAVPAKYEHISISIVC